MKILMSLVLGLSCCFCYGQIPIQYNSYVVTYPVLVQQQPVVQIYQPAVVQYVPVYQPVVVQNMVVPVVYPGNWPIVVVNDQFYQKRHSCLGRWVRPYHYGY